MSVDSKNNKRNGKKFEASKLFSQLPKGLEHLDMLQVGMNLMQEAQKQAHVFKKEAIKEAGKVFVKLQTSYGEMSSKFSDVSEMAKKQAEERMGHLIRKWNERKEILPQKLTKEVDQFLNKSGLINRARPAESKKAATSKKAAPKVKMEKKAAAKQAKPVNVKAKKVTPPAKKAVASKAKASTKAQPKKVKPKAKASSSAINEMSEALSPSEIL